MKNSNTIKAVAAIMSVIGIIVLVMGASSIATVPAIMSRQSPSMSLLGVQASQYYNQMILGGVLIAAGVVGFLIGRTGRR